MSVAAEQGLRFIIFEINQTLAGAFFVLVTDLIDGLQCLIKTAACDLY